MFFRYQDLTDALRRHFRKDLEAERMNIFDENLQGYRAFETSELPVLQEAYNTKFPRTPVDWEGKNAGLRNRGNVQGISTYSKMFHERSDEQLPEAKTQKTLNR